MKASILLVEDDPNLGMVLSEYLQLKGGFGVCLCKDGEEGKREFHRQHFDLCVFDIMLPKKDGFSLAKELRSINSDIPIIFATARSMMEDKTEGFNIGGDDYITKPFRIEELLLRINALLKRRNTSLANSGQKIFDIGKYLFNYESQSIELDDHARKISSKEAELLRLLCLRKNELLTRQEALLSIWNNDSYFNGRSMDVFLSKLRKYLKDDHDIAIMNVHGKGYKLITKS